MMTDTTQSFGLQEIPLDRILYIKGDATRPFHDDHALLLQVVNNVGLFGAGFAKAVDARWPQVKAEYLDKVQQSASAALLGEIQIVNVEPKLSVVNMFAQDGVRSRYNSQPLRYQKLAECLQKVAMFVKPHADTSVSIHMPRIGAGLAGGDWKLIEPIILLDLLRDLPNVKCVVYDLPNNES